MKNIFKIVSIVSIIAVFFACNKPKNIPDKKMKEIVAEIFLSNAYIDAGLSELPSDSLNLYGPILKKYGYTAQDMIFTLEALSKRKSVKFTDIVAQVSADFKIEADYYHRKLAAIDSVDNYIARKFKREIYSSNKKVVFKNPSDPKKPDVAFNISPGRYIVSYNYYCDTLNRDISLQYRQYQIDSAGNNAYPLNRYYRKGERRQETGEFVVESSNNNKKFEILWAFLSEGSERKSTKGMLLEIDSVRVDYYLPKEVGRDSMMHYIEQQIYPELLKYLSDETEAKSETIVPLRPHTTGVAARGDTIIR